MSQFNEVVIESLAPKQQYEWAKNIAVQTRCFFQVFIKFAYLGIFHSYAELLHAVRLESNPNVSYFTPQPINIYIDGCRYVPDCFHVENGRQIITEIKSSPSANVKNRSAIEEKLNQSDIDFRVIDNASILKDERELLNWLHIIRCLVLNKHLSTVEQEDHILELNSYKGDLQLFDLLNHDDDRQEFLFQLACMRLLYDHKLVLKDPKKRMGLDSWVQ